VETAGISGPRRSEGSNWGKKEIEREREEGVGGSVTDRACVTRPRRARSLFAFPASSEPGAERKREGGKGKTEEEEKEERNAHD